jgi:DNA-binding transcriptional ArsR family regulator
MGEWVIHILLPNDGRSFDEQVTFACVPLADCLLALYLLANDTGSGSEAGANRVFSLMQGIEPERMRAIRASFDATLPVGLLASVLAMSLPGESAPSLLIDALRALPDTTIVAYALSCGGALQRDAPRSTGVFRSLMDDPVWAAEYVRRFLSPIPADPMRIIEIVTHPARTRQRLADLLAGLFDDLFAPLLPELHAVGRAAEARMRAVFQHDPAGFVAAHVPDVGRDARGIPHLLFWPSAFLGAGWATFGADSLPDGTYDLGLHSIAYGAEMLLASPKYERGEPGEIVPEVAPPETYQDVYRLLADPARWTLIQLLVAAPRYGQELAELLGLSIATVSHHLNGLKRLDLVDIRRDEHRLYYHLRTDRLRALLAGAEQGLLTQ